MKVALAIWNERIAPVFDAASQVLIVDVCDGKINDSKKIQLSSEIAMNKIIQLADLNVSMLVCGAISNPLLNQANAYGIKVNAFVSGQIAEILQALLQNRLDDKQFVMPGCTRRRRWRGGRMAGKI
jgi:predicted Fe-Mo cluster-binding NifX family protein